MSQSIVGTCSLCNGPVVVPNVWYGTVPPTPTCSSCGAIAAAHGPVIPMVQPRRRLAVTRYTPTTVPLPSPLQPEPFPPVNPWEVLPFDPPPNFPPSIPWWETRIMCDHSVDFGSFGGRFQA